MRSRDVAQFLFGFRQGDVEHRIAIADALLQELQSQRGLAGARRAFEQIKTIRGKAPADDRIEPRYSGLGEARGWSPG